MSALAFLEILLPDLALETVPEMSLEEVLDFFSLNLSPSELHQIKALSDYYDVENVRSYLLGQAMTARGNIPRHRLQEKILDNECAIPGTEPFFNAYPDVDAKKRHAHELMPSFLKERSKASPSFIQKTYLFEYQLRHLFAYLRAEKMGKPYEIESDDLSFSLSDINTWPLEFLDLPKMWLGTKKSPLELEHSISKWKFDHYEAMASLNDPFSIENILIYFLKLRLLESRKNMKNPQLTHTLERMAKAVQ